MKMGTLNQKHKNIIYLSIFLTILIGITFFEKRKKNILLNSNQTKNTLAVMYYYNDGRAVQGTRYARFKFIVNKKTYKFEESGNFSNLNIGDTVEIIYSLKDTNIARVVNKCFMKKYKPNCGE
jgi:hypothetical protein